LFEAALKDNVHLKRGVLTGVQYIVHSGMLSALNNLSKHNITSLVYAQHYGVSQEQLDQLLSTE
jgi:hypothetical protein